MVLNVSVVLIDVAKYDISHAPRGSRLSLRELMPPFECKV